MFVFPSKEFKFAKELIDEGKYEEGLQYKKDVEQKKTLTFEEKLDNFINSIQKSSSIWETLEKNNKLSRVVNINDIPQMENLVTGIFLN